MEKFKHFLASTLGRVVVTIVTAVLAFGLVLLALELEATVAIWIIIVACTYFGWRALNFITPNIFLTMPIGGWLIYYVIKGVVALAIGYFVMPFQIGRIVSKAVSKSVAEQ